MSTSGERSESASTVEGGNPTDGQGDLPSPRMGWLRGRARRASRLMASPVLGLVNRRFADLHEHLTNQTIILTHHLEVFSATVERRLNDIDAVLDGHHSEMEQLRTQLFQEIELLSEMSIVLERAASRYERRLADVWRLIDDARELLSGIEDSCRTMAERAATPPRPTRLADLDEATARYLNWARSYEGLAGEAGCWVNDGYYLEFVEHDVRVRFVNERVVELPFAYAVAAGLDQGSPVLDVGAAESPLALGLASMGLRAVALDPRGYPFEHPNLTVVVGTVEEWKGPETPLAAVFCISTLEHLGLAAYGQREGRADLDRLVLERFSHWLRSDGVVVLTIPVGERSEDRFERVYDAVQLDELLTGWKVIAQRFCRRVDDVTWIPAKREDVFAGGSSGVGMFTLALSR